MNKCVYHHCLGEGDSPILPRGLGKIGTVPDGRWLAAILAAMVWAVGAIAAHAQSASRANQTDRNSTATDSGNESLGSQLLDDLDPKLFGPTPNTSPSGQSSKNPAPARPDFQKRILPGVSDDALGEDIGQPPASGPLVRVQRSMETAQSLIREPDSLDRAGQVQRQVVADLDALIEQLAQQCRSGNCQSSGQRNSPSQRSQVKGAKLGTTSGKGSAPARDSTPRLGRNDAQVAIGPAERESLLKDLWGHLPPHAREQMLQSYSDEFLPQYELEIERYFRRLAEEQDRPPSR